MHVERYAHLVRDVQRMLGIELGRSPQLGGLPRFLFGHSAGAVIALDVAAAASAAGEPFAGMVLTSPMLYVDPATTSAFNLAAGRLLSNLLPKWPVPWVLGPDCPVSSHPPAQAMWDADPLVYRGAMRPRQSMELFEALQGAQRAAGDVTIPYLAFHGTADKVCLMEGTEAWHARTSSRDKELVILEGACHEVLHEGDETRGRVMSAVVDWVAKRA